MWLCYFEKKLTCASTEKKSKEIKYNNILMPIKG